MSSNKKNETQRYDAVIGRQPRAVWVVLSTVALIMIVVGTVMPLLGGANTPFYALPPAFKFVYSAGALALLVSRLFSPYTGSVVRVKRLYRIETWSSIFFCVAAFFLFYEPETSRDWLAFTLAGGAIQVYTSIMIPRAVRKALADDSKS